MLIVLKQQSNGFSITLENIDETDIYEVYNKEDIIKFWKYKPGINLNMFATNNLYMLSEEARWGSEPLKHENYIKLTILNDCNDIEFLKNKIIEHIEDVLENDV